MRPRMSVILSVLVLAISAVASHADTFTYSFTGLGVTFSFEESALLTTDTVIPASEVTSDIPDLVSVEVDPLVSGCGGTTPSPGACVGYTTTLLGGVTGFDDTFTAPGTYTSTDGDSTLTITESAVPEPATWSLLGLGATAFAGTLRRRMA